LRSHLSSISSILKRTSIIKIFYIFEINSVIKIIEVASTNIRPSIYSNSISIFSNTSISLSNAQRQDDIFINLNSIYIYESIFVDPS